MTPDQYLHVQTLKDELDREKSKTGPGKDRTRVRELRWEIDAFTASCNGEEVIPYREWLWESLR